MINHYKSIDPNDLSTIVAAKGSKFGIIVLNQIRLPAGTDEALIKQAQSLVSVYAKKSLNALDTPAPKPLGLEEAKKSMDSAYMKTHFPDAVLQVITPEGEILQAAPEGTDEKKIINAIMTKEIYEQAKNFTPTPSPAESTEDAAK